MQGTQTGCCQTHRVAHLPHVKHAQMGACALPGKASLRFENSSAGGEQYSVSDHGISQRMAQPAAARQGVATTSAVHVNAHACCWCLQLPAALVPSCTNGRACGLLGSCTCKRDAKALPLPHDTMLTATCVHCSNHTKENLLTQCLGPQACICNMHVIATYCQHLPSSRFCSSSVQRPCHELLTGAAGTRPSVTLHSTAATARLKLHCVHLVCGTNTRKRPRNLLVSSCAAPCKVYKLQLTRIPKENSQKAKHTAYTFLPCIAPTLHVPQETRQHT